ncbi:MAG: hypothetical protein JO298_06125 [Verrucomicrobia bacterium]|nr:hypothetical protein [Verrucomicrobiota bacterium]
MTELLKVVALAQPGVGRNIAAGVRPSVWQQLASPSNSVPGRDRYQDWAQVRSDLAVAVNDALLRNKIAIA